jgi:hypothetical protein
MSTYTNKKCDLIENKMLTTCSYKFMKTLKKNPLHGFKKKQHVQSSTSICVVKASFTTFFQPKFTSPNLTLINLSLIQSYQTHFYFILFYFTYRTGLQNVGKNNLQPKKETLVKNN